MIAADDDLARFRDAIARHLGLFVDDSRVESLADALATRLGATGSRDVTAYLERVGTSAELRALAPLVTVGETYFFRNAEQFRALAETVLPERIAVRAPERRLRVVSAGCATGEEAYSLAITLRELLAGTPGWDLSILGVDVNPAALARAATGRYSPWSLRATPDETRRRYFREDGRELVLAPEIRAMVRFEERNLAADDPLYWASLDADVVFCRNVLMYFAPSAFERTVARMADALAPGGYLFLGSAETLRGVSTDYHLCHTHGTFYYRLRSEPRPAAPAAAVAAAPTLAIALDSAPSWLDAIQRSSERIAKLAASTAPATTRAAPPDLARALELTRQERFDDALAQLRGLPDDDADVLLLRAALLTNRGDLAAAERACRQLLAIDDLNAGAHYLMALCREHAGDRAGAIEHDQTAIYLDPELAMPRFHLGIMSRRAGDTATSRRALEDAVTLLAREDASRLLLFGGGFSREALIELCRAELRALGGDAA